MAVRPLLKVHNLAQTKAYYRDKLRFSIKESDESMCVLGLGADSLSFTTADFWSGEPAMTGTIYIDVDDVVAYYALVQACVTVTWPLQTRSDDSKEFGVRDCNGYSLAFAQRAQT